MSIEDDMWFIPEPSPRKLAQLYDELTRMYNAQERNKAMSEETKKTIEEAGEFFKKVLRSTKAFLTRS